MTDQRSLVLGDPAGEAPAPVRRRWPRSNLGRRLLAVAVTMVVVAAALGYWVLDRYFIDHVAIGDVAAYEAAVTPSTITPPATDGSARAAPPVTTATSYTNGRTSIEISTVVQGSGSSRVTYFVADVELGAATQLRSGFANNKWLN